MGWGYRNYKGILMSRFLKSQKPEDTHKEEWTHSQDHYKMGEIQPIEVIEDWNLGFCLGNAVKYIARAEHKGSKVSDLEKVIWYVQRELDNQKII